MNIRVFSITGEIKYSRMIERTDHAFKETFNLGALPAGSYILSAEIKGKTYTSKLIIK
jgi:hypothetical protein